MLAACIEVIILWSELFMGIRGKGFLIRNFSGIAAED
jgi:hypothetical protein